VVPSGRTRRFIAVVAATCYHVWLTRCEFTLGGQTPASAAVVAARARAEVSSVLGRERRRLPQTTFSRHF
jgi:hypothetical protein